MQAKLNDKKLAYLNTRANIQNKIKYMYIISWTSMNTSRAVATTLNPSIMLTHRMPVPPFVYKSTQYV